jgi:hypothetical protein
MLNRYGVITVEIAENKKNELADAIRNCPQGKGVQLQMKKGHAVNFEII